ncbi:plasmid mobilization protein, partial [Acinetobacter baumannii]|nr:plasmid mobilization protein [Acinetobacter baumannii]
KELGHDIDEIIQTQQPILHHEKWDIDTINFNLNNARLYPEPDMEFKVRSVQPKPVIEPTSPKSKPEIQPSQPEPKRNDYDGPGF